MDSTTQSSEIDVYEIVTNRIIELLESATIPWQQPWSGGEVPMNLISKRPYRGINVWLLASLQYERNLFLTWEQLKAINGSVHKGEHGHVILFWKNMPKKPEELDEEGEAKTIPMLRYYKVFNIAQCRDIPESLIPIIEAKEFDPIAECEALLAAMPDCPQIRHKEPRAFYNPLLDSINMPKQKSFKIPESYYATLFHEIIHWTGSEKRLHRKTLSDMKPFGSESYAMEELIAEMGSAFLCHHAGILPAGIKNTAAYLKGWLGVLRNDKKFIITAAGQAQKAADYILGRNVNDSIIETHHPVETVVVS